MPKVFRPTLKQSTQPAKSFDKIKEEPPEVSKVVTQPISEIPASDLSESNNPIIETTEPEIKSVSPAIENNPTDLDSDINARLLSLSSQDVKPRIKLFATKKTRRPRTKIAEPSPSVDEPLNRSSVTLRSLLNWVPSNKPPPTYRQERLNPNLTEEPDNNSTISSIKQETGLLNTIKSSPDKCTPTLNKSEDYVDPLAPQLRLDADGNIVLDESSLVIKDTPLMDTKNLKHVVEETGILGATYNSFKRRPDRHGGRWTEQETVRFYRALATMGTDFYSMEKLFPNRTRPELKRKFKREEKINPYLVNQALRNRRAYDITALLTLSDEDENEEQKTDDVEAIGQDPIRVGKRRRKAGTDPDTANSVQSAKPNHKFPKIEHKKRRRPQRVDDSQAMNQIVETIDTVLSQTDAYLNQQIPSTSVVRSTEALPFEYQIMFNNLGQDDYDLGDRTTPVKCNQSLLDKMIASKEAELAAVQQSFIIEDLNPSILAMSDMELSGQFGTDSTLLLVDDDTSPRIDLVRLCKEVLGQD